MFGSHLSIAGNMSNALREAEALGLDTVQVFTKNQRQWKVAPLADDVADEWLREVERLGWQGRTVAHNSYLINLACPDDDKWERAVALQREEIERCERLRIPLLVSHPGSHLGSGEQAGLARIAQAYLRLLKDTPGYQTVVCLENTVGSGANLGGPFEHLRDIRAMVIEGAPKAGVDPDHAAARLACCFDTCHAHAFGHDMSSEERARAVLDRFDEVCGLSLLRVIHMNDSKGALGSRRDLHEHIGHGTIGVDGFAAVVRHPGLASVPKIMETPKGEAPGGGAGAGAGAGGEVEQWDSINLGTLKGLIRDAARTTGARPAKKSPGTGSQPAKAPPKPRAARKKAPARRR